MGRLPGFQNLGSPLHLAFPIRQKRYRFEGTRAAAPENRLHPRLAGAAADHHTLAMVGDHRADAGTAARHEHAAGVRRAGCIQEGVAGQQQGAAKGCFPKRRTPQAAAKQEGRAKNQQRAEHPDLHKRIIGADGGKREPCTKRGRLPQPLGEQRRALPAKAGKKRDRQKGRKQQPEDQQIQQPRRGLQHQQVGKRRHQRLALKDEQGNGQRKDGGSDRRHDRPAKLPDEDTQHTAARMVFLVKRRPPRHA